MAIAQVSKIMRVTSIRSKRNHASWRPRQAIEQHSARARYSYGYTTHEGCFIVKGPVLERTGGLFVQAISDEQFKGKVCAEEVFHQDKSSICFADDVRFVELNVD